MFTAKRILIVDAEVGFTHLLARNLKRSGHVVAQADSAAGCIAQAQRFQPDVIMLDPAIAGHDLASRLAALKEPRPFRVVFVTSAVKELISSEEHATASRSVSAPTAAAPSADADYAVCVG